MTIRLHIIDTPWRVGDLWPWWRWQCSLPTRDPNCVNTNPAFPRFAITEKLAFGMRLLLFWRQMYRQTWTLGGSTRQVSFQLGRHVWSCGGDNDPAFQSPTTRDAFLAACNQAAATARGHFRLPSSLSDGAVRFHAFYKNCSRYDMSAFQEAYSPGTSEHAPSEAEIRDQEARRLDPTGMAYAPVVMINGLFSTNIITDWATTVSEENDALAILFGVLMHGVSHWPIGSQTPIPLATIQTIHNDIQADGGGAEQYIPLINIREFHRVVFYCNATRLNSTLENHLGGEQNRTKCGLLLEIMDTCIQRRFSASSRPSLSAALLQRDPSHLLY